MLEHVATSDQVTFEGRTVLDGSEGANSRRSLYPRNVIDVRFGTWDKTVEQVTAVTAEIENDFDVRGDVLLKDYGERCAPLLHGSGGEPSIEFLRVPGLATLAQGLILRAAVVEIEAGFLVGVETGFSERKITSPAVQNLCTKWSAVPNASADER